MNDLALHWKPEVRCHEWGSNSSSKHCSLSGNPLAITAEIMMCYNYFIIYHNYDLVTNNTAYLRYVVQNTAYTSGMIGWNEHGINLSKKIIMQIYVFHVGLNNSLSNNFPATFLRCREVWWSQLCLSHFSLHSDVDQFTWPSAGSRLRRL